MKIQKRFLALLTATLLLLPLTGCLVPKETETSGSTASSGAVAAPDGTSSDVVLDYADFDRNATAIELGDIRIPAGEVDDMFYQYVSEFSYSYEMDNEMLDQLMRMTEEELIQYHMPEWKAAALGITLSEEQEAACAASAQQYADTERDGLLLYYSEGSDASDVSGLSDEQRAAAIETINELLEPQFGIGYTFEDYLALIYEDCLTAYRGDAFTERLKEWFHAENPVDEAQIDEWYESALAAQQEQFTANPEEFLYAMTNYIDFGEDPVLFVPAEAAKLEMICISGDGSNTDTISENEKKMGELEAEYGKLALSGEDEARQAEIKDEYARLKAENEASAAQSGDRLLNTAQEIMTKLDGGMSFADAMKAYNQDGDITDGSIVDFVFIDGSETQKKTFAEAAKKLTVSAYSEPISFDGDYYIIRLAEIIPQGVVDRASIKDELDKTAADLILADAWTAQTDAWLEEAKNAAVYHRETYDMLVTMYLG